MSDLRDIRPIFEFSDYIVIFSLALASLLALIFLIFILLKLKKYTHKDIDKIQALQILKNLNYQEAKNVAYSFSKYAAVIINQQDELEQLRFKQLNEHLEQYKYKKTVGNLDLNLIKDLKDFIAMLKIK